MAETTQTFEVVSDEKAVSEALATDPRINDVLLHVKDKNFNGDDTQNHFIAFPFTKFDNVLGRPRVAPNLQQIYGAPYVFLTNEINIPEEEYSVYFAHIQ